MTKKINPNLTAEQKLILFEEGTELPGTSELNHEKREGSFHCANCGEKLFDSKTKYESGSGWPSFYESLPDVFETKTDHHLGYARTEYHCKKCGGHHDDLHIFYNGIQFLHILNGDLFLFQTHLVETHKRRANQNHSHILFLNQIIFLHNLHNENFLLFFHD